MKVEIRYKELYPFYYINNNGPLDYLNDVEYETLKRWEKVSDDFIKVQLEMAELIKHDNVWEDMYEFVDIKDFYNDDCE